MTFDYLGAGRVASFRSYVCRALGLVRTSLVFGLLNAGVGLWATWLLKPLLSQSTLGLRLRALAVLLLLGLGLVNADALTNLAEEEIFPGRLSMPKALPTSGSSYRARRLAFSSF